MPRTKLQRKKQNKDNNVESKLEQLEKMIKDCNHAQLAMFEQEYKKKKLCIPSRIANMTIGEFDQLSGLPSTCTTLNSEAQIVNRTRILKENSRYLLLRRSNSFVDGYLTAGSSENIIAAGEHESRLKCRQAKQRRISKSSSPLRLPSSTTSTNTSPMRKYRRPQIQLPPNTSGTITPKVNLYVPQVLLRRPKPGEMALSLQSSPLYTGAILKEAQASINIPLEDDKLLTLQPQRGLRLSQIPELNPLVARQLEILRDNLNKVCEVNAK